MTGPVQKVQFTSPKELRGSWKPSHYHEPATVEDDTEFALGSCKPIPAPLQVIWLKPRYKPKMIERLNEYNKAVADEKAGAKPLYIGMVGLDSFSRRHFYRKLP